MILIADSGSTKTELRLIADDQTVHTYSIQGINPYFQNLEQISDIIKSELITQLQKKFSASTTSFEIHFYGAGCGTEQKRNIVKQALAQNFKSASIQVNTDLFGAAYGLCGEQPGIVAILGTGANTCYYDGKKIIENRASLGYILGDEGSGAHIGKTFIQAHLNEELPKHISELFIEKYKLSLADILDSVYRKPLPNRFLASISKFVFENLHEDAIHQIVTICFEQFFDKHICKYSLHKKLPLNCVGSIAFYFSKTLESVAKSREVKLGTIVQGPIDSITMRKMNKLLNR